MTLYFLNFSPIAISRSEVARLLAAQLGSRIERYGSEMRRYNIGRDLSLESSSESAPFPGMAGVAAATADWDGVAVDFVSEGHPGALMLYSDTNKQTAVALGGSHSRLAEVCIGVMDLLKVESCSMKQGEPIYAHYTKYLAQVPRLIRYGTENLHEMIVMRRDLPVVAELEEAFARRLPPPQRPWYAGYVGEYYVLSRLGPV